MELFLKCNNLDIRLVRGQCARLKLDHQRYLVYPANDNENSTKGQPAINEPARSKQVFEQSMHTIQKSTMMHICVYFWTRTLKVRKSSVTPLAHCSQNVYIMCYILNMIS